MSAWGRVGGLVGRDRRLWFALVMSVTSTIAMVVVPLVLAKMTNVIFAGILGKMFNVNETRAELVTRLRAEGHGSIANLVNTSGVVPGHGIDWPLLWQLAAVSAVLYLVGSAGRAGSGLILNNVVQQAVQRLRTRVGAKLHRLPIDEFTGARRGEVLSAATNDIDNLSGVIGPLFVQLPVIILTVLAISVALLVVSPLFGGIVLAGIPVAAVAIFLIVRRATPHLRRQWQTTAELSGHVEDAYSARGTIVAYGATESVAAEFDMLNDRLRHASRSGQTWSGAMSPTLTLCNALIFVVVAVVGAFRMLDGAITLGALQAVVLFASQLSTPLSDLSGVASRVQSGLVSLGRVADFLSRPDEAAPAVDDPPVESPGRHISPPEITFENLVFGYGKAPADGEDGAVLRGLSLTVQPGHTIALVGETGAGKTTITALLQRFHDPWSGRILIDGVDIAGQTRSEVRSQMAVVTQEPWLMSGTAEENIAFGADDDGPQDLSQIAEILDRVPGSTVLSGDGAGVSAGERQLITVARALAARPRILILDEATSAADPRSELLIQRGLSALRDTTTTIVVTHRMSTLAAADEVAVLADGQIVQRGTLRELLNTRGHFSAIHGAGVSG
jgi:ATP-binding cassette subfamily B protein